MINCFESYKGFMKRKVEHHYAKTTNKCPKCNKQLTRDKWTSPLGNIIVDILKCKCGWNTLHGDRAC